MTDPVELYAKGGVDLTTCDREPIHLLGRVQDFGCLIAISSDWIVAHASENCSAILGLEPAQLLGASFTDMFPRDTVHALRGRMQALARGDGVTHLFGLDLLSDGRFFNVSIHRANRYIVLEFETADPDEAGTRQDALSMVQALIGRVQRHRDLDKMLKEAATCLRVLLDIDRVMVYRFEADGSGHVLSESLQNGAESFLGLRYPASDIPKQARALYTRNLLRLISDAQAEGHAIVPPSSPDGEILDLSLALTRAVSPIHLEYLRNMGVRASLSGSILRRGELWGLFACHNMTPFHIGFAKRNAVELFVQLFNYELAQLEVETERKDEARARELHDRLMAQMSSGQNLVDMFEPLARELQDVIAFDGIAIYSDGTYIARGSAPTEEEFFGLARFLNRAQSSEVFVTDYLIGGYPEAEGFLDRSAGLMAMPISRTPRDYLVMFRREVAQSVLWAGNPEKPAELGPNRLHLTPRKSFTAWRETVRGRCAPWLPGERRAAETLRVTLLEVVLKMSDAMNETRKKADEQQELLIAELNHRVRNILNLIRGLISQSRGESRDVEAFSAVLDHRIHALARAHDQLTRKNWDWVPIRSLVDTEVEAFLSSEFHRVTVTGDPVDLSPPAFTTMALVLHELVTNSVKYGALSVGSGTVGLDIELSKDGGCRLRWRELGGPVVQPPKSRGFGTTIIERSVPFELRGKAEMRFKVTGLEVDFWLPSSYVRASSVETTMPPEQTSQPQVDVALMGEVLILEDNMIIALDGADMLTELGAEQVHTASRVAEALNIHETQETTFAMLDINLGDETSIAVCKACEAAGIPFILATGYGGAVDTIDAFPEAALVTKPFSLDALRTAIPIAQGLAVRRMG